MTNIATIVGGGIVKSSVDMIEEATTVNMVVIKVCTTIPLIMMETISDSNGHLAVKASALVMISSITEDISSECDGLTGGSATELGVVAMKIDGAMADNAMSFEGHIRNGNASEEFIHVAIANGIMIEAK